MQEYKQEDNQSSAAFSFDPYANPQKEQSNSEGYEEPGYTYMNAENPHLAADNALRRIVGSALMSFGAAMIVFLAVTAVSKNVKEAKIQQEYDEAWERIEGMEEIHETYHDLDELFRQGAYEEMLEEYLEKRGETNFGYYSKQDFLSLMESAESADEWYEKYTDEESDASYIYAAYLYYTFNFLTAKDHYNYQDIDKDSKEVVDERIAKVRARTLETLGMNEDELDNFINSFREDGSKYVDYSKITEYARKIYGD